MNTTIRRGHSLDKPTLGDLMRRKGPIWAADCIVRRHQIHPRHAALFVGMLGVVNGEVRS